jgi:Bacterial SH3 domain
MLRLTFVLCAALFTTLLIGGRDYGQLRPGLADALAEKRVEDERAAALALAEASPAPVANLVEAAFTPEVALPGAPAAPAGTTTLTMPLVEPAAVEPAVEPAAAAEPAKSVWFVTASSVNVREGPGKTYGVLGKLTRGDAATLVWADDTGWARIRIEGDGIEGFVSTEFLSETAP